MRETTCRRLSFKFINFVRWFTTKLRTIESFNKKTLFFIPVNKLFGIVSTRAHRTQTFLVRSDNFRFAAINQSLLMVPLLMKLRKGVGEARE